MRCGWILEFANSFGVLCLCVIAVESRTMKMHAAETKAPLTFAAGHDTNPKDHGRPIVLIAAALEVKEEVFREAFSGVTPARDGRPSGEDARRNKEALMKVLKPHGVTNERLDEVSDYYRYQPQKGKLWKHTAAKGHAIVEDDQIKAIVITTPGAGYSSTPKVTIKGQEKTKLKVILKYGPDLAKNGSVESVEVVPLEAVPAQPSQNEIASLNRRYVTLRQIPIDPAPEFSRRILVL